MVGLKVIFMKKSTKILICVVAVVLVVCIAIIGIYSALNSGNSSETVTGVGSTDVTDYSQENTTQMQSTTAAPGLDTLIIGKWMDSANMSGFEFKEGGAVSVTYVNLTIPVINFPVTGTANGSYIIVGDQLTVNFSIYTKTISNTYTASVSNNTLTLVSSEDGEKSTYERQTVTEEVTTVASSTEATSSAAQTTTAAPVPVEEGIYGTWQNSDGSLQYAFNKTGIVNITFQNADVEGQKYTGRCDGVFILNDTNKITIQYSVLSKQFTDNYTYKLKDNSLELKKNWKEKLVLVRSNQSAVPESELLGNWQDSSKMSGMNFKENGIVDVTYVNFTVPVINMPINGTYTGGYSVDGDRLKINFSIYSKSIELDYTYKIEGNTLTLTNTEDGKTTVYTK